MRRIYLDYNATTPVAAEVREAMQPFLAEHFGNPSSSHALGRACGEAIADAREQLAALLGVDADNVIYTGCGTESNNLALKGVFLGEERFLSGHLIISSLEHPAIAEPAAFLAKHGVRVTVVPCDGNGIVDPDAVRQAIAPDTRLVSVMLANNEVGTLQPIRQIAQICRERDVLCHTDAAQAVGKIRVDAMELDVDMLTVAGHKLYAPKGIGALYVHERVDLTSLVHGANHERGLRAGTENTPYIVGLGKAAKLAASRLADDAFDHRLRDRLLQLLQEGLGTVHVNGDLEQGLPNTLSVGFPGVTGQDLLDEVPEICASTGAACHSGATKMSATLEAMQVDESIGRGTLRLSTGAYTTEEDVTRAGAYLVDAVQRLQA